jgi:ribosome-associated protein
MRGRPSAEVGEDQDAVPELRSRGDARREQKKSEEHLMQLGMALTELSDRLLARLDLPEEVVDKVVSARAIRELAPKSRALRLVRIALRATDAGHIQNKLRDLHEPPRKAGGPRSPLEEWQERLLAGGEDVLSEFLVAFPDADRRQIRQLARNARAAIPEMRAGSLKALTRALRTIVR